VSAKGQRHTPRQCALALLTRREHSRRELTAKLRARGHAASDIEQALERLLEEGWQSDVRFADTLVRHRAASGYGPRWIRAELATHALDPALIESALDGFEGNWAHMARDLLVRRKLCPPDDGADWPLAHQRKAADLLLRRGFEYERLDALFMY